MSIFETERLIIRRWALEDAEAALAIYGDPDVMRGLAGTPAANLDDQRERLTKVLERNAGSHWGMWAMETRDGTGIVGSVILKPLPESEWVEVGWHLAQAHWGKGYATEAGAGAIRYGFHEHGLPTIYAVLLDWNIASRNVTQRLGMRHDGQTDRFYGRTLELFSLRPGEGVDGL